MVATVSAFPLGKGEVSQHGTTLSVETGSSVFPTPGISSPRPNRKWKPSTTNLNPMNITLDTNALEAVKAIVVGITFVAVAWAMVYGFVKFIEED
jgi:hypothetical protein